MSWHLTVNSIEIGDSVIVPDDLNIYCAEVVSDYYFDETGLKGGFAHRRAVEFYKDKSVNRRSLSLGLQKILKRWQPLYPVDQSYLREFL